MPENTWIRSKTPWIRGLILILFSLNLVKCMSTENSSPGLRAVPVTRIPPDLIDGFPSTITPTPFQPLPATRQVTPIPTATPQPVVVQITPAASPLNFYGIDLSKTGKRIRIKIIPKNRRVNAGKPLIISFLPGEKCDYGDQHACVSAYQPDPENNVIFVTTHSGVGGEAEEFRYAVEGMGLNRSGFPLERVRANLRSLSGADVIISQAGVEIKGLQLVVAGRVPAAGINHYFSMPIEQALETAASMDPTLVEFVHPAQMELVFETCGWKMPAEPWAPGVTSTTGSVYLGVIQKKP